MWRPLAAAGVHILEDLPEVEALFGCGGVEREQLSSFFQLRVIHLKKKIYIRGDRERGFIALCSPMT